MGDMPTIVVIDYHAGNVASVARGLARAGARAVVSDDPRAIAAADGLALPGVGGLYDAAAFMARSGQAAAVIDAIRRGVPFLGICLGMQLLFERGTEGVPGTAPLVSPVDGSGAGLACGQVFSADGTRWVRALGVLRGSCTMLDATGAVGRLKVPHVGWDQVYRSAAGEACPLLAGVPDGANMYFTHSFAVEGADAADVAALAHYVRSFPAVVSRGRVFGCQFHPEKSSDRGAAIMANFVREAALAAEEVRP